MMTTWHNVDSGTLPTMQRESEWSKWESKPVLAFTTWGEIKICVLERWEDDDDPAWFSDCSEHWGMDHSITHWAELPEGPKL